MKSSGWLRSKQSCPALQSSADVLRQLSAMWPIRIVAGDGRGAAAAINVGIRAARHAVICQVDQDVVLRPGWMAVLVQALNDPDVAAAQGYYVTESTAPLLT